MAKFASLLGDGFQLSPLCQHSQTFAPTAPKRCVGRACILSVVVVQS